MHFTKSSTNEHRIAQRWRITCLGDRYVLVTSSFGVSGENTLPSAALVFFSCLFPECNFPKYINYIWKRKY